MLQIDPDLFDNKMVVECYPNCAGMEADDPNINDDEAVRGIRVFSALVGVLLLTGVLANGFIIWLTTRRHFLIRWQTFRLSLRYSKIIDLSLCAALAATLLWPRQMFDTGCDVIVIDIATVDCKHFGLDKVLYTGVFAAASGVVVVCRQVSMLCTFEHEDVLLSQHSSRTVRLLADVVIVSVVSFTASLYVKLVVPDFDLPLCFVVHPATPRVVYLFVAPAVVTLSLAIAVVARPSGPADSERPQSGQPTTDDLSDKATLVGPRPDEDEVPTHSTWNRLVIVTNVPVLTWCLLLAAVAMAGLLLQPVSVGILFTLTSCTALDGVWSVFSLFRHWT